MGLVLGYRHSCVLGLHVYTLTPESTATCPRLPRSGEAGGGRACVCDCCCCVVAGSGGRGDGVIVDAKSPSSANKADVSVAVGTESDETDSVEPCPCCPMSPVVMRGKARRSTARHSRTYQQTAPLSVRVGGSKSQQQDNIQNRKSTASTAIECSCSCSAPTTGDNLQLICGWAVCMNACMSLYLLLYMYQEALLSPSLVLSCQSVLSGQKNPPYLQAPPAGPTKHLCHRQAH